MANNAKRRSAFINNIPSTASVGALKSFLLQELEKDGQNQDHLLKIIFPVSPSNPRLALATFHDEKAMVALMRKQLVFEGEPVQMQPFLSRIFSSMTAIINPDVTDLFPFSSQDFTRLMENQAGVDCRRRGERDTNQGLPIALDDTSQELYTLTGNWYQLQNARKFLQEWVVSDANWREITPRNPGIDDKKIVVSSSTFGFPQSHGPYLVKELSHERTKMSESLANGHDSQSRSPEEVVSRSKGSSAKISKGKRGGQHVANESTTSSVKENEQDTGVTEDGQSASLAPDMNGLENSPHADRNTEKSQDNPAAEGLPRHQKPSQAVSENKGSLEDAQNFTVQEQGISVPGNGDHGQCPVLVENKGLTDSLKRNKLSSGSVALQSESKPRNQKPSEAVLKDKGSLEDGQGFTLHEQENSFPGSSVHGESSVSVENFGITDILRQDRLPSGPIPSQKFPSIASDRSDITVGSSIDYMKRVKMPPSSLGSLHLEARSHQKPFGDDLRVTPTENKEKGEETLLPKDDSKMDMSESVRSSHPNNQSEGLGSLPVDPGVFSYILLKKSDSISEIEKKYGVKFSMNATRHGEDSDNESALLKITPTRATAEIVPAHDEFVDLYSHIFSILKHRVITAADLVIDPESLAKTVDQIHELYESVVLTVSNKTICIYGLDEVDIRLAKACVFDASKQANQSKRAEPGGLSASCGFGQPRSQLDGNSVIGQPFSRGEADSATEDHTTVHGHKTQIITHEKNLKSLTRKEDGHSSAILEIDNSPKMNGHGLMPLMSKPTAHFVDEAVDYQAEGGPKIFHSATSHPVTAGDADRGRQPLVNGSVMSKIAGTSGTIVTNDTGSFTDIIPVDPGVFAFIRAHKHTILCDIEQNYGIQFNVKGNLDSDVCMVEVKPAGSVSETAAKQGKEAFGNFYSEVFQGLHHRVLSLGDFDNITDNELADIIQEMELSFSDLLFRVVGSRVLIYGQGRHNVESARDLIKERLRRSLESSRMDSVLPSDDSTLLESLGSEAMIDRLNRLRLNSLSSDTHRSGQTRTLSEDLDSLDVHRELGSASPEEAHDTKYAGNDGHIEMPVQSRDGDFLSKPHEEQKTAALKTPPNDSSFDNYVKTSQSISGADLDGKAEDGSFRFHQDKLIMDLSSGIRLQVYCRDITRIQVDAIVSCANEKLYNIAGIAGAIRRAAGELMQADCNRYIARHGLLHPGKVITTEAGNLPCRFVLHAVGPRWNEYPDKQQCRDTLRNTVLKCLRLADEKRQVASLAVPFISSGIFEVPFELCVEEICEALTDFNQRQQTSPNGFLHHIHIVDIDKHAVRTAQDIMISKLSPHAVNYQTTFPSKKSSGKQNVRRDDDYHQDILLERRYFADDTASAGGHGETRSRAYRHQGASLGSFSSKKDSSSSDEDVHVPYRNLRNEETGIYGTSSGSTLSRSTSLPYLPRGAVEDEEDRWAHRTDFRVSRGGSDPKKVELLVERKWRQQASQGRTVEDKEDRWAYRTDFRVSHGGSDPKKVELLEERKRHQQASQRSKTAPILSTKDAKREDKVQELLDTCTRGHLSPELSRQTEYELDRLLTEQERRSREKHSRPVRRTQSLDRSRRRPKCFACSSPGNLVRRKGCDHYVCEICKGSGLDVGRCKECGKTKAKKGEEKKCDLCFRSSQNLLVNCKNCAKTICIYCIRKGLKLCQDCLEKESEWNSRQTERMQPKLREPMTTSRVSRLDTKNDYRIKPSSSSSTEARRKPMRGLNQPLNLVGQSYTSTSEIGRSRSGVATSPTRHSAFSKEFVTEEAPHDEVLRHPFREPKIRPSLQHDSKNLSTVTDDPQRMPDRSRKRAKGTEGMKVLGDDPSSESKSKCTICLDEIKDPKSLSKCQHTFCSACIDKSLQFKPVCPICGVHYGKLQGNQPEGTMNCAMRESDLPGHPGCGTIIITYNFPDGVQNKEHPHPGVMYMGMRREAYLPNSEEGQGVLALLKKAFDARLLFTVGCSVTTGQDDVIVWNDVHHKTRQTGGATKHGYPDPGYLQRVREELKAKGIE